MKPFVKTVDPSTIENEVELQKVAIMYGYSPQIIAVTDDEIFMEDLEAPCLADIYGDEAAAIPEWIWDSIRTMLHSLYTYEGIEYTDITGYNFIEKDEKIYLIDFGHARYKSRDKPMNWFLREFLDGENAWNPDFK
jgi:tRNA A-37 threonylcarbamoyl transferase component Bud32